MSDTRDIYRSTGLPRLITEPFTTWIWTADGGYEVTVSPDQANAMVRAADADAAFLRGWRRADERRADVSEPQTMRVPRAVPVGLLCQFVESIGFDPDEVELVSFDLFAVTVEVSTDKGRVTFALPVDSSPETGV